MRYQGQLEDKESGLYYNLNRYYDADSGQYLSPDPIGFAGGLRPQAYVDNPMEFVDPLGLAKGCPDGVRNVSSDQETIFVTEDGVALVGSKHQIPDNYVQNPYRAGSYGERINNKFKERLRIDPATPPNQKGPNYSHYHKNGKGTHYSPRDGDPDPGF